jgi:hypothetical protein|tara:strand:- start:1057 stop:1320 length:264 start_codon:yes stop_codon:yes gene_type:complete
MKKKKLFNSAFQWTEKLKVGDLLRSVENTDRLYMVVHIKPNLEPVRSRSSRMKSSYYYGLFELRKNGCNLGVMWLKKPQLVAEYKIA